MDLLRHYEAGHEVRKRIHLLKNKAAAINLYLGLLHDGRYQNDLIARTSALTDLLSGKAHSILKITSAAENKEVDGIPLTTDDKLAYVHALHASSAALPELFKLHKLLGEHITALKPSPDSAERKQTFQGLMKMHGLIGECLQDSREYIRGYESSMHLHPRQMKPVDLLNVLHERSIAYVGLVNFEHVPRETPLVLVEKRDWEHLFDNLFHNAVDAGARQIEYGVTHDIRKEGKNVVKNDVVIHVSNDGQPIPSNSLEKIFVRTYTTKGIKGGTGHGLADCRKIVEKYHGTITASSDPGKPFATRFVIRLPADANVVVSEHNEASKSLDRGIHGLE